MKTTINWTLCAIAAATMAISGHAFAQQKRAD